ncbi:hypothetical protein B0A58_08255 [Flavobacterium branchiophilum NBRC 15030 = ATCC 35035]|uniref:Uncharacterized protein n=1 Tax=Flavobacterium branchiophilum TaxID=55197 RepID=A0A543G449_9FLAO|nr:hypothetical protein [Flavobacterium branchiophilum]OXA75782.1 hypothetical protein B0A58_08255 [Flavobacterium branchiophilum NBRC 15030 = ATCC 35035]TQM40805.1 hypothetical protein BC670_1716 [Flavobacterium branchiophilum]GEM54901.1 hypothetical protein FB1_11220 [Flavobacterium branchiophilum NBRC 15030 = ATCC 35035]
MTFETPQHPKALWETATNQNLYSKLVVQITKDFNLANEALDCKPDIAPEDLQQVLHEKIYQLIAHKFGSYLNLLYIIDVPENQIKALDGSDLVVLANQVCFLILKREWMKVWYKAHY